MFPSVEERLSMIGWVLMVFDTICVGMLKGSEDVALASGNVERSVGAYRRVIPTRCIK